MLLVYLGLIWVYSLCLKISSSAPWLLLSVNMIWELMGCQPVPKALINKAHVPPWHIKTEAVKVQQGAFLPFVMHG